MIDYSTVFSLSPFSLDKSEKRAFLTRGLIDLTKHHYQNCEKYRNLLDSFGVNPSEITSYEEIPFLPVRLFKDFELRSIPEESIFKTMTSSGTTGQAVSKIYLDKDTAANQQKTLVKIVSDFTGASRLPMLIIDSPSVIKDRNMFSARGAGVLGFSIFGADKTYALDDNMALNLDGIIQFLEKHKGQTILLFGFTFMIWEYFYKSLKANHINLDLSNGVLIHGGGWKKLITEAVSHDAFHELLFSLCGISRIHDYYGMVEQTGCIYMECECGHLHSSIFSDVIIRDHSDFAPCELGIRGIIQVVSLLPGSYPGHSLLTEDEGELLGEDDCSCGRKGKYFKIHGRIQNAEIRGCSDTHEKH